MSASMEYLSNEEKANLADMQLNSLEVLKTPVSEWDVAIKSYVDSKVATAEANASSAVTALLDGAPVQLNTLKELATALNNDANLASVLTVQISAVSASVTTEASARSSADATLSAGLSSESNARDLADATLNVRIDDEVAIRVAQKAEIDLAVSTEVSNRISAVSTEMKDREDADASLRADLNLELSARSFADEEIGQRITLEVGELAQRKFDSSPYYSGGSESHFKVSTDAYLYIGDNWRIRANTGGSAKRLEFQYSADGSDENFKTAVPFIRG